jgi:parvulin-like peptidyl-prolyl isomerase
LRARVLAGESFTELAKKYSEDPESAPVGGNLGTLELEQLDKDWYPTVSPLKTTEISEPVRLTVGNTYGYHVILMKKRIPAHPVSLEQDYQRIETIALNYKRSREYAAWLQELKSKIYWQSRL